MPIYYEQILTLSTLLHYANLSASSDRFYALKNRLLDRYGRAVGYDVQYLGGKECWSCDGSGVYWTRQTCYSCDGTGWHKWPVWNVLLKRKFGRYTFHTPVKRCYSKKELGTFVSDNFHLWKGDPMPDDQFTGYVDHRHFRWSEPALIVLYLLCDREQLKYPDLRSGLGWGCKWWLPLNYLNNILHLYHFRSRAIPVRDLREKWRRFKRWLKDEANYQIFDGEIYDEEDIPF